MDAILETKDKCLTACRILEQTGVFDDFTHFSVWCEGERILMNPSMSPAQMTRQDLLLVDLNDSRIGSHKRVGGDAALHFALYRKRPDVKAIAHIHSPMVVSLSIAGIRLKAVENVGSLIFPAEVPLFDKYGTVIDMDRATEVANAMGQDNIIVLRGHGAIIAGKSIEETCITALFTERCARLQYLTVLIGGAFPFPETCRQKTRRHNPHIRTLKTSWNYYASMLKTRSKIPSGGMP